MTWVFEGMGIGLTLFLGLLVCALFYFYSLQERLQWLLSNALTHIHQLQDTHHLKAATLHEFSLENRALTVQLEEEKKKSDEKMLALLQAQEEMRATFKALSSDTLRANQSSFFELAKETFEKYQSGLNVHLVQKEQAIDGMMKPLRESLEKVDVKIQELEKSRHGAYVGVTEQLKAMQSAQVQLQSETANLVRALRAPNVRGKWGEMQLKRVVEMAGMLEYCDFTTQTSQDTLDGKIRPDLLIRLPNARTIIVDSKAPLLAYLEACELSDEDLKVQKLKEHARQLKKHLTQLGDKAYFEDFERTPEFVVLFLPGESFFSAALEHDPSLIEYGVDKKVLLATPTTLIALLRSVALGWQEKIVAEHAEKISELGKTLYERLLTMVAHFQKLKRALDTTTNAYNKVVGCFESRVLVAARHFQEMGVADNKKELEEIGPVEKLTRLLEAEASEQARER